MNIQKISKQEYYALLKRIYVDEMNWLPENDNVSNVRIEDGLLIDDFYDKADYFGFSLDNEPVFGFRIIKKSEEIKRYTTNENLLNILNDSAEINRLVIDKKVRKMGLVKLVGRIAFDYCKQHKIPLCITASDNKNLNKKYKKVPRVKIYENAIHYPEGSCNAYAFPVKNLIFQLSQSDFAIFRGKNKQILRKVYAEIL